MPLLHCLPSYYFTPAHLPWHYMHASIFFLPSAMPAIPPHACAFLLPPYTFITYYNICGLCVVGMEEERQVLGRTGQGAGGDRQGQGQGEKGGTRQGQDRRQGRRIRNSDRQDRDGQGRTRTESRMDRKTGLAWAGWHGSFSLLLSQLLPFPLHFTTPYLLPTLLPFCILPHT